MAINYPVSARRKDTRVVGGVSFEDPYSWLFPDSDEAIAWQSHQDELTKCFCGALPGCSALRARIRAQLGDRFGTLNRPQSAGGQIFSVGRNDADTAYCIRVADEPGNEGRELLSLDGLDEDGRTPLVVIMSEVSHNGHMIAVATAQEGEHVGSWRIGDAQRGVWLPFRLSNQTVMNSALPGWIPDTSSIFLHDRTEAGLHRVCLYDVAKGEEPVAERVFSLEEISASIPGLTIQVSPNGRWAVAVSEPHHRAALAICDLSSGDWRPFLPVGWQAEAECHGEWFDGNTYAAATTDSAERGRVVLIPAANSRDSATWREIVPSTSAVIRAVTVVQSRVVVAKLNDISLAIDAVNPSSGEVMQMDVPAHSSSMIAVVPRRFPRSDVLIVPIASFVEQRTLYQFEIPSGARTLVGARGQTWSGIEVKQYFAAASDGERIPYFVVHRSDLPLDQSRPLLMTAYGGFNAAWLPFPLEQNAVFVEAGGIFVHGNVRGGGEYGTSWWKSGICENLQRSADDLHAVAEDVIARGLSQPERMAFTGFSHGGYLAGVTLVQRPDLWRVVVPQMPIFDLMETSRPGVHGAAVRAYLMMNYGDAERPEQAAYLFQISPYHNIVDGRSYPTVYALHGENDLGCAPFHGRRFIARLQSADPLGNPHLLRVWKNVAHGTGDLDVAAEQYAEWMGLTMRDLGLTLGGNSSSESTA